MYATNYHRPTSVDEARRLYGQAGEPAYLSGGHTLLPAMKLRLAAPSDLIDLSRIEALKGIEVAGDEISIGGGTTHATVAESAEVRRACSTLATLAGSIGDPQVRHLGTIGGSVANNDPAADYPAACLALAATIHTDQRRMAADDYFVGLYTTALEPGEIVTRVSFRIPAESAYAKFRNPASRYPMAGVFVARHRDGSVRVAVTGAGNDGVFRWPEAEAALAANYSADALRSLSVEEARMMGDIHASPAYRANLVRVMAQRALQNPGTTIAVS